jgi:hypothetical protein
MLKHHNIQAKYHSKQNHRCAENKHSTLLLMQSHSTKHPEYDEQWFSRLWCEKGELPENTIHRLVCGRSSTTTCNARSIVNNGSVERADALKSPVIWSMKVIWMLWILGYIT